MNIFTSNEIWYTLGATISCFLPPALAGFSLKPKYKKEFMIGGWALSILAYFAIVYMCFISSVPRWYDYYLFFAWFLMLIPVHLLYKDKPSTKMFLAVSAIFIANVTSFMSGSLSSVIYPVAPEAYWIDGFYKFIMVFTGVKTLITAVVLVLCFKFLKNVIISVFELLDGKMLRFLPIPFVAGLGFFFITQIVQRYGLYIGEGFFFLAFYLMICSIFAMLYWLVFSNATWSSRAMRTEAEMNVASKIQQDMLPSIQPDFDDRREFDIFASMQPAKEVGGDFYDFFFVDEEKTKLAVIVADVSGKGVPAALFMVIAKTLIKDQAMTGIEPSEVFTKANNLLCESNGEGMFVTAFMGILDIPTGQFTYVNAGHNLPLIKQGGKYDWLKARPGFILAGMDDIMYRQASIQLNPGDKLFLYTDGVTEALNPALDLYSDPRLLETINKAIDMSVDATLPFIRDDIFAFANGHEQADDITMLAIEYHGPKGKKGK